MGVAVKQQWVKQWAPKQLGYDLFGAVCSAQGLLRLKCVSEMTSLRRGSSASRTRTTMSSESDLEAGENEPMYESDLPLPVSAYAPALLALLASS